MKSKKIWKFLSFIIAFTLIFSWLTPIIAEAKDNKTKVETFSLNGEETVKATVKTVTETVMEQVYDYSLWDYVTKEVTKTTAEIEINGYGEIDKKIWNEKIKNNPNEENYKNAVKIIFNASNPKKKIVLPEAGTVFFENYKGEIEGLENVQDSKPAQYDLNSKGTVKAEINTTVKTVKEWGYDSSFTWVEMEVSKEVSEIKVFGYGTIDKDLWNHNIKNRPANNSYRNGTLIDFIPEENKKISFPSDSSEFFKNYKGLITGINKVDTSETKNMASMFANTVDADPDVGSWNTSKVTNMANMFEGAVTADPNVSNWNTEKVKDM